jgi:hypothetical protein
MRSCGPALVASRITTRRATMTVRNKRAGLKSNQPQKLNHKGVYCTRTYMTVTILGRHGRGRRRLLFLKGTGMKTA